MNDDLPNELRQNRDEMREISAYAKEHGYTSKVTGNKLVVNGRHYQHHELSLLPKDILLERVQTRRLGDGIAFQGETSCLSNFFPCYINIDGRIFNSSEQAYQYTKCIECKKEDTAHQIMLLSMPREIKSKGDKTESTPEWEYQKLTKMEEIVTKIFSQNPDLRKKLIDTGNYPLYEATTNQFWGCGLRMNSRLWSSGMYPGRNNMGQILMKVREKMRDMEKQPNSGVSTIVSDLQSAQTPVMSEMGTTTMGNPGGEQMDVTTEPVSSSHDHVQPTPDEQEKHGTQQDSYDSSSSDNRGIHAESPFRNFATNREFDICKVNSWKLPTVKRNTKEWADKQRVRGLLKRRRSDKGDTKLNSSPPYGHSPPQRKRATRSFINLNYQNQLLKEHGYDRDSVYQRAMSSYNKDNITDRRSSKK